MKKFIAIAFLTIAFTACKNSEEKEAQSYSGEFLYFADAAVLKGTNFIYGVTLDEMTQELAKQVEPVKKDQYDMVQVTVKGIVSKKEEGAEGWDEIITIKEIISVSNTPSEADIKIEEKKS